MKHTVLVAAMLSSSVFAFEPPKDQECVEVQRECQPDVKEVSDRIWYLAADCSVRVVKDKGRFGIDVTDMKPEPKYECKPKAEIVK